MSLDSRWLDLEDRLEGSIESLVSAGSNGFIIVDAQPYYVQYAVESSGSLLAEASSCVNLPDDAHLSGDQIQALLELGWTLPTPVGNFSAVFESVASAWNASNLGIATLRDVLTVSYDSLHLDAHPREVLDTLVL